MTIEIKDFTNVPQYSMDIVPMHGASVMLTNGEVGEVIHLEERFTEEDGMVDCWHVLTIRTEHGHTLTIVN